MKPDDDMRGGWAKENESKMNEKCS